MFTTITPWKRNSFFLRRLECVPLSDSLSAVWQQPVTVRCSISDCFDSLQLHFAANSNFPQTLFSCHTAPGSLSAEIKYTRLCGVCSLWLKGRLLIQTLEQSRGGGYSAHRWNSLITWLKADSEGHVSLYYCCCNYKKNGPAWVGSL